MLEYAYMSAEENNADITIYGADFFDDKKRVFIPCDYSFRSELVEGKNMFSSNSISDKIFNFCCGWSWDKLFKTSFVRQCNIRFQEIRTTNDMLFVFYLLSKADCIFYFDEILVHRRINIMDSLSATRERSWDNFYLALYSLKERLISDGTYEKFRKSFVNWALNLSLWHIDTISPVVKRKIIAKCRNQYFSDLDISCNEKEYFLNNDEYERMKQIMDSNIKVSVIIPVYNGEKYLKQCLDTVCAQTLGDIQIICVDDGSTDSTPEILE